MTNPFAAAVSAPAAAAPAPAVETAKPAAAPAPAPAAGTPGSLGIGDPFAAPIGIGDGERITDFIGNLLLIKPTEYIREMNTSQGKSDAVRVDLSVLDDETEPGKIVVGVLLFQQALKREAKATLEGDLPYLLGRLNKGKTGGGNTLYTFLVPTEEDADEARKWLKLGGKL
jgi:hypothetical protein